jgi:hypothetical protein
MTPASTTVAIALESARQITALSAVTIPCDCANPGEESTRRPMVASATRSACIRAVIARTDATAKRNDEGSSGDQK